MNEARHILVIEDDPMMRELLADWLLAAGYHVRMAANGGAGIADAQAQRPALVVTDMCMPGTAGAAVISEVARMHPAIPVIAISAHFRSNQGPSPEGALALGAARTLAKPFKRKDLLAAVIDLAGPPAG